MLETPILFIVYNRLDLTKQVFDKIKIIKPRTLFIAADGPRGYKKEDLFKCIEVRKFILENINWNCEVKTLFREQNLGCGKAVSLAITWFFENVEQGIILEDDCLPDLSFFRFCGELLERYKYNEKIILICGTNILEIFLDKHSYTYSLYGGNWGWATWRRSWKLFDYKMESWRELKNQRKIKRTLKSQSQFLGIKKMFDLMISDNRIDTWDIQWFYTRLLNNKVTIVPVKNLVKNIGFGNLATHTFEQKNRLSQLELSQLEFPLIHNVKIKPLRKFDEENAKTYGWFIKINYINLLKAKVKYLIKKILRVNDKKYLY